MSEATQELIMESDAAGRAGVLSSDDQVEVVVIGGGPAGMLAAYRLTNLGLSVRGFEASSEVGGRTYTALVAGEAVNTGAMFVYVGTESEAICDELGVQTVPVTPATFGVHLGGRTVLAREDAELLAGLDLPAEAAAQLERVMREVRAEYDAYTGAGGLTAESVRLSRTTFTDHLGPLHPAVDGIIRNTVTGGSTASPDELSAQYALRYFASYLVRAKGHRRYIPLGMQEMSRALERRLPNGVMQRHSPLTAVTPATSGDGYELTVERAGRVFTCRARHVVFAVPGPGVGELAPWLPEWKLDAIAAVPTSPTVTLSIVLDSTGLTEWDDLFVIATVEPPFNLTLQPRASADVRPSEHGRTYFNCYLSADAEAAEPGDDEALTSEWLEHFYRVVPQARGRVLGTLVTRWTRCFAHPRPDRERVLPRVTAPIDGLHFAGDYASVTAGSHGAFATAERVVREIGESMALLRRTARVPQ
jgi:protoporphyrinogen oxidase